MTLNYAQKRKSVERAIKNVGKAHTVVKKGTKGGFDASGNVTADVPDIEITGIITPLLRFKQHEIDGQDILASDSYVFFHSDDVPEIGMQTTINSEVYRVVDIKKIDSLENINVYRRLQLRN